MPPSTNDNTVSYILNALKKHVPQPAANTGQVIQKDPATTKAEEAKKKREADAAAKDEAEKKKKMENIAAKAKNDAD